MENPNPPHASDGWRQGAVVIFLVLLTYWPTFTGEFLLDDHTLVESNSFLEEIRPFHEYFLQEDGIDQDQWGDAYHTGYYRPLVSLSYALDRCLWGNRPVGYRATNLALHLVTCLILLGLLRRHGASGGYGTAAVLFFALHPVNTEAVAWISSRNNIMATLFSMLSLTAYAAPERRTVTRRILAPFWFALAVFSKEFGLMLLPILFVWNRTQRTNGRSRWTEFSEYFPFVGVLLVYFCLRMAVIGSALSPHGSDNFLMRLLMAPYLALVNLSLVLFPLGLHSFTVAYPQGKAGMLAGAAGAAGLFFIGWLLWRRSRAGDVVFGLTAFGLGLLPVLNIVPTSAVSLISMRWLYFPAAFLTVAVCRLARTLLRRPAGIWIATAVLGGLGGTAFFLNLVHWHDDTGFYRREVTVFGNAAYAGGWADWLHGQGELAAAERYYLKGLAARPDLVENHINYAALLIDTGRPQHALAVLDRIAGRTVSRENSGRLANNRALALARLGRLSQALPLFEKAVALAPGDSVFWANLASAYAMGGHFKQAAETLESGLARFPSSTDLRAGLVRIHLDRGDAEGAARVFAKFPASERQKRTDLAARIRRGGAATASRTDR